MILKLQIEIKTSYHVYYSMSKAHLTLSRLSTAKCYEKAEIISHDNSMGQAFHEKTIDQFDI